MKRSTKFTIITILVLLGLVIAYDTIRYLTKPIDYKEIRKEIEPADYVFIADGKGLVVSWKYADKDSKKDDPTFEAEKVIQGKRYLMTESYRFIRDYDDPEFDLEKLTSKEYWKIKVYDLSKQNLSSYKEYDLLEAVRQYDDLSVPLAFKTSFYTYDDKEYSVIVLRKVGGEDRHAVLFNLATGKIEEVSNPNDSIMDNRNDPFLSYTDLRLNVIGEIRKSFDLSKTEQNSNVRLMNEYPKAYKLLTQKASYLYTLSNQSDIPTFAEVDNLLLPKDKEIFHDLTVYKEYTKDGQDHVVNSLEEFEEVLKEEYTNGQD